jgi:hypothetical protein
MAPHVQTALILLGALALIVVLLIMPKKRGGIKD